MGDDENAAERRLDSAYVKRLRMHDTSLRTPSYPRHGIRVGGNCVSTKISPCSRSVGGRTSAEPSRIPGSTADSPLVEFLQPSMCDLAAGGERQCDLGNGSVPGSCTPQCDRPGSRSAPLQKRSSPVGSRRTRRAPHLRSDLVRPSRPTWRPRGAGRAQLGVSVKKIWPTGVGRPACEVRFLGGDKDEGREGEGGNPRQWVRRRDRRDC